MKHFNPPCKLSHVGPARQQVKARAQSRRSRVGVALPTGGSGATTTPDYSLSDASTSQPQSVEGEGEAVTATEGASLPLALLARDAPKMRAAAELLNAWQIEPHDLWCGALLGRGGQAEVFGGRWQGLPVAIKKQRAEHRITPAAQRSMEQTVRREVRALTRVRHPNVVRLFGACMEPTP